MCSLAQRMLWEVGGNLAFGPPTVEQYRWALLAGALRSDRAACYCMRCSTPSTLLQVGVGSRVAETSCMGLHPRPAACAESPTPCQCRVGPGRHAPYALNPLERACAWGARACRNVHTLLRDFHDELDLYNLTGHLIELLNGWQPPEGADLPGMMVDIGQAMADAKMWAQVRAHPPDAASDRVPPLPEHPPSPPLPAVRGGFFVTCLGVCWEATRPMLRLVWTW